MVKIFKKGDNVGYMRRGTYTWFLVKPTNFDCGFILIDSHRIYFPKEYIGKKIRIKVEVKEE